MTNPNKETIPEPDGIRWLKMLGREDLVGKEFTLPSGRTIFAEDFPAVSKDGANMMYVLEHVKETSGTDDPLYANNMPIAREFVEKYFGPPPTEG